MKITILGTGNVGSVLGKRFAQNGHEIIYGTRNPSSDKIQNLLAQSGNSSRALLPLDAIKTAEVIVLATPWRAIPEIIKTCGPWKGKILIDCTNPLKEDLSGLEKNGERSAAEDIAAWANDAHVIKAFNTTGSKTMENPSFGEEKSTMFVCGNHKTSKQKVIQLAEEIGFEVIDAGDLFAARYLEALAIFWIHLAFRQGLGPDLAIKILRR